MKSTIVGVVLASSRDGFRWVGPRQCVFLHRAISSSSAPTTEAVPRRTYDDAIARLNELQTPHGRSLIPFTAVDDVLAGLARMSIPAAGLSRLNVVHVAGTKGKGTVCAMVDSILRRCSIPSASSRPPKVGLLTSPHLIATRERIRIDGAPLSEESFARYFFLVHDALAAAAAREGRPFAFPPDAPGVLPAYARFITLMALVAFLREGVDVAVLEAGIGGAVDATNAVPCPAATGITSLGIDHVDVLGTTIREIAGHKAGIMKPPGPDGTAAFAVRQRDYPESEAVLRAHAARVGVDLVVTDEDPRLSRGGRGDGGRVRLRPDAPFQRLNASLAVRLAAAVLSRLDPSSSPVAPAADAVLPPAFVEGLENVKWRGRCEVKEDGRVVWFLDCAHTVESLRAASTWFGEEMERRSECGKRARAVLAFNQQMRATETGLLDVIYKTTRGHKAGGIFERVFFCTPLTYSSKTFKPDLVSLVTDPAAIKAMTVQRNYTAHWTSLDGDRARATAVPTIQDTVECVRALAAELPAGERLHVFVTGGVHTVGGFLSLLEEDVGTL